MSLVFIISAPSGSGKSTLVNELRNSVADLDFSVSYTTRKPRGSEQDSREYYFVDRKEFQRMIDDDEFLEHADVFGNYYGTARRFLLEAAERGHDLLLDIDVQGAAQMKARLPEAISIFVLPPSREELERRLRRRSAAENMKSEEVINRRLQTAAREIENYRNYDYILINDNLEESIDALKAIVLAERMEHTHKPLSPEDAALIKLAEHRRLRNAEDRIKPILESFALSTTPAQNSQTGR
jgi:guanylate kinase